MTDWDAALQRAHMLSRTPQAVRFLDALVRGLGAPAPGPEAMRVLLELQLVQVNAEDPARVCATGRGQELVALLAEAGRPACGCQPRVGRLGR